MNIYVKLKILVVVMMCLEECSGLMCYFCQDTSSQEKRNSCQTWIKTMRYYRRKYNKEGTFSTDKYVKNCTGYANKPESDVYCMVARIESRGEVRSFIRDCSDREHFFDEDWNSRIIEKLGVSDAENQTTCIYVGTSDAVCVTLCKDGHFCNGPINGGERTAISATFGVMVVLVMNVIVSWNTKT